MNFYQMIQQDHDMIVQLALTARHLQNIVDGVTAMLVVGAIGGAFGYAVDRARRLWRAK